MDNNYNELLAGHFLIRVFLHRELLNGIVCVWVAAVKQVSAIRPDISRLRVHNAMGDGLRAHVCPRLTVHNKSRP